LFKFTFYFSLFLIFYVYLGYPGIIIILSRIKKKQKIRKTKYLPTVTIIISAYNEEQNIEETLLNKLNLDYPEGKVEIIVVSDASNDLTDKIVKEQNVRNIRLIRNEKRSGKTVSINKAMQFANSEIVVFADANSIYRPDALQALMNNFSDPNIGYVTGKMIYQKEKGSAIGEGCSFYMKYENYLRKIETNVGSIVGVDGGIDAVRRDLFVPMKPDQLPDFVLPLIVFEKGYRVVFEPSAILLEQSLKGTDDEFKMRIRVALRAFSALKDMRHLLNIIKYGLFSLQLWSHKVLRYLCFLFMGLCLISNAILFNDNVIYQLLLLIQLSLYGIFISKLIAGDDKLKNKFIYVIYYFILINVASAIAFVDFLLGKRIISWTPRKG
jgi:cellulose synthase/poly-beta-1,6-N-acetylglucosamine synthase-like glycosyltransferase